MLPPAPRLLGIYVRIINLIIEKNNYMDNIKNRSAPTGGTEPLSRSLSLLLSLFASEGRGVSLSK
jgi:hypothetical protein